MEDVLLQLKIEGKIHFRSSESMRDSGNLP